MDRLATRKTMSHFRYSVWHRRIHCQCLF